MLTVPDELADCIPRGSDEVCIISILIKDIFSIEIAVIVESTPTEIAQIEDVRSH